jgi:hypothetical protein
MCKPYLGLINNINYKSPFIVKTFQDETNGFKLFILHTCFVRN